MTKKQFEAAFSWFWVEPKLQALIDDFADRDTRWIIRGWTQGGCYVAAEALRRWWLSHPNYPHVQATIRECDVGWDVNVHVVLQIGPDLFIDPKRIGNAALFAQNDISIHDATPQSLAEYDFDELICRRLVQCLQEKFGRPPIRMYVKPEAYQKELLSA